MNETTYYRFVVKRDTAAAFTAANTLLLNGEWALETDTGKMKVGDGVTAWATLPYVTGEKTTHSDLFSDFVVSGLLSPTSANLTSTLSAGTAYVTGQRVMKAAESFTYAASSDTYEDMDAAGVITRIAVANGAAAPAVTANTLRLQKVVTDATAVTVVTRLATLVPTTSLRDRANHVGEIIKGAGDTSALDIRANDQQGHLVRFFTDGLDLDINPTAMFNAGAHFRSVGSALISGVPNGLTGSSWDVVDPSDTYTYMLGVWADVGGPAVIFRANADAGQAGSGADDANPLMFLSGDLAKVVMCVEDDGSLSFGAGLLRTDMDARLGRVQAGMLGIDVRSGGAFVDNAMDGSLGLKVVGCTLGGGVEIAEGTNARMGVATLVGGTVTVSTTEVTADSRIFLTSQTDGGTPGFLRVSARTAGTSFTITSSSATDTSAVAWEIKKPFVPVLSLGPELVSNGTFDTSIAGWAKHSSQGPATMEWVAGELHVQNTSTGLQGLCSLLDPLELAFAVVAGKSYRVTGTLRCASGVTALLNVCRTYYGAPVFPMVAENQAPGTYSVDATILCDWTGDAHLQVDFRNLIGDVYVDNLSVREVL